MMSHYESVETMLSDVNLGLLSLDGFKLRRLAKQGRKHGLTIKETIPKDLASRIWSGNVQLPPQVNKICEGVLSFMIKANEFSTFKSNSSFILFKPI